MVLDVVKLIINKSAKNHSNKLFVRFVNNELYRHVIPNYGRNLYFEKRTGTDSATLRRFDASTLRQAQRPQAQRPQAQRAAGSAI